MGITVGGGRAWRTRKAGELFVSYQWVNRRPAMLLYPSRPPLGAGAFVIPLESAWAYADSVTGEPTPFLVERAALAAEILGMFPTRDTIRKVADVIVDGIPDLVRMPPEPDWDKIEGINKAPAGELKLILDGQTIAHTEVPA